ncbi:ABC transporter ATP-binding protein [Tepidibacillus marianensis]|uniref:ABC transporter ATP-binding protein n=1 Tax=Tepidibacillus marianensis TaxID=3131995 RepID=UPI0030CFA32E
MLRLNNINKVYGMGNMQLYALKNIDVHVKESDFVAIMGPSGSGKSTLMNVLGCLDKPTSGEYFIGEHEVSQLSDDELASIRNQYLGFIFQNYNLLPTLTAVENVELPLIYRGLSRNERREKAFEALTKVGLQDRLYHRPSELSGGQQQRVAIARAIAGNPTVLLADEPTGNLDSRSELEILAIFQDLNRQGMTIMIVTHDEVVAEHCSRIIRVKDGEIMTNKQIQEELRKDAACQLTTLQVSEVVG